MTTYVAVCGADPCSAAEADLAEEVGRLLARAGAILVCGGLGGAMEAASRGAASEGGTVVGFLPGTDRDAANAHVTVAIPTGMGEMRNALVVRTADVVIAIGGEFGTLSEIAFSLKTATPVVGLGTWDLARPGRSPDPILRVATPEEAVHEAIGRAQAAQ